jgi:hypothetical protein
VAPTDQRLLRTAIEDSAAIVANHPGDAFPQIRFTADRFWRVFRGERPIDTLRRGGSVDPRITTTCALDGAGEVRRQQRLFLAYLTSLVCSLQSEYQDVFSTIGSRRLVNHLLDTYDAATSMPYASDDHLRAWLASLSSVPVLKETS